MDGSRVSLFVGVKVLKESLRFRVRSKFGENTKHLTTCDCTDVYVMTKDSAVGCRDWEGNLCQCRVEGIDIDDSILLCMETEDAKYPVDLNVRV